MGGERKQGWEKQRKRFFPKKTISLISPRISLCGRGNKPLISTSLLHNQGGKTAFRAVRPGRLASASFWPSRATPVFIPFFPDFVPKRLSAASSRPHLERRGTAGGREETTASTLK